MTSLRRLPSTKRTGLVSRLQRFGIHDGPGIRTTVFLKGCPLRCAWCHNPENLAREPQILVAESRCIRCGACSEACPNASQATPRIQSDPPATHPANSLAPAPAKAVVAPTTNPSCTLCGACVDACPTGARTLVGREYAPEELVRELLADSVFFDESGGGVTFSGGEPLLQFDFLLEVLQQCREQGLNTAVDTCGFSPPKRVQAVGKAADLILYDLKCVDDTLHRQLTGVSNRPILGNLRALSRAGCCLWIRIPLVPGQNDNPAELGRMAGLLQSLDPVPPVQLLPYHPTGIAKYPRVGLSYPIPKTRPPTPQQLAAAASILQRAGIASIMPAELPQRPPLANPDV